MNDVYDYKSAELIVKQDSDLMASVALIGQLFDNLGLNQHDQGIMVTHLLSVLTLAFVRGYEHRALSQMEAPSDTETIH